MKNRYKIIAVILALFFAAATLASCGSDEEKPGSESRSDTPVEFESIEEDTKAPETEKPAPDTEKDTEEETEDVTEEDTKEPAVSSNVGLDALGLAEKLIGTKFRFGGIGPDEFDNSGFIYYIFKQSGVEVPRLARDMPSFGKAVARADIQPGDILVFANEIGGGAEFEGIYAGDGQFIACFNPDKPTQQAPIGNYWEARFITARRAG